LVELLLARDYQVHAQSRRTDSTSLPQHGNLHWHTADICDPVVLHTLMAVVQPDEIYNLASISRPSVSWQIPRETADTKSGTSQSHSIRAFCEAAFRHVGCNWANHVTFDHSLFRTINSHHTVANCAKIAARLAGVRRQRSTNL
jgi:GDPmannose 4,6-dehydratase